MADGEYEMQLFEVSQKTVVSYVKQTFREALSMSLESISKKLATKYGQEFVANFQIAFMNAYNNSIEKHSAELERIVAECFSIDPSLLLPEDEVNVDNREGSYEDHLDRNIAKAEKSLYALYIMEEKLKLLVEKISGDRRIIEELNAFKDSVNNSDVDYSNLLANQENLVRSLLSAMSMSEPE